MSAPNNELEYFEKVLLILVGFKKKDSCPNISNITTDFVNAQIEKSKEDIKLIRYILNYSLTRRMFSTDWIMKHYSDHDLYNLNILIKNISDPKLQLLTIIFYKFAVKSSPRFMIPQIDIQGESLFSDSFKKLLSCNTQIKIDTLEIEMKKYISNTTEKQRELLEKLKNLILENSVFGTTLNQQLEIIDTYKEKPIENKSNKVERLLPLTFNNGMETPINIVIDHDNSEILKKFFIKIKKAYEDDVHKNYYIGTNRTSHNYYGISFKSVEDKEKDASYARISKLINYMPGLIENKYFDEGYTRSGERIKVAFGKNRSRLNESEKVNTMNISSIGYALLKKKNIDIIDSLVKPFDDDNHILGNVKDVFMQDYSMFQSYNKDAVTFLLFLLTKAYYFENDSISRNRYSKKTYYTINNTIEVKSESFEKYVITMLSGIDEYKDGDEINLDNSILKYYTTKDDLDLLGHMDGAIVAGRAIKLYSDAVWGRPLGTKSALGIVHNTTRKEGSFRLEENQIKIIDIITKIIKIRKEQIKDKEYITRYKGNSILHRLASAVTFHNTEKGLINDTLQMSTFSPFHGHVCLAVFMCYQAVGKLLEVLTFGMNRKLGFVSFIQAYSG